LYIVVDLLQFLRAFIGVIWFYLYIICMIM
jgi:hypothetical protein